MSNRDSFRFANDSWKTKNHVFGLPGFLAYDKVQHFIGGLLFGVVSPFYSAIFWFLWEVKDAIVPYENSKFTTWFPVIGEMNWGGDGFSWKDLLSSLGGSVLIFILTLIL